MSQDIRSLTPVNGHPDVPTPQFYVGDFNCQHVNWGYNSGESRIIFLPERSSIYQYRHEISAIIVTKQSRTRLLFAHPLLYILKTQKIYCAF